MTTIVDNIKLDKNNVEFNKAAEFVNSTDKLIYLTGKAGTGKTTFLKYIKETTDKNTIVLAPTGVAAINAGGVTIYSFFQIPFGPFVPNDSRLRTRAGSDQDKETIFTTFQYSEEKRKIIKNLELLIIDEISMVRADILDLIDSLLRVFRWKPYLPFGGVQVILIGDTFQLPPIADNEHWNILSQYYKTPFFFSAKVIEQNTPVYIELKKIYRQKELEFIDLLNRVRINDVTQTDFELLNSKYDPTFTGNGMDYIILATHNKTVNETNITKLNQLQTELFTFEADIKGDFPDKIKPTEYFLKLKVGAQIMFVKNDVGLDKRFYNGKIGKIKELGQNSIIVEFDDESEVEVERTVWHNIRYTYDKEKKKVKEEVIGSFEQFPIRLAWAITVHKSQGLTFEKVIADLGRAFAPGQVYVALSRCTSFSGLKLKTRLIKSAIKTDPKVLEFAKNETPGTLITEQLNTGKADYFYKKARESFASGKINLAFDYFKKAMKFRNDIDTELFEKFIKTHGARLTGFREKFHSLSNKYAKLSEELDEAFELIEMQSDKIEEKDKEVLTQNESISSLKNEKGLYETEIHQLNKKVEELSNEINSQKKEIERLRKLTWYDKLFGRE